MLAWARQVLASLEGLRQEAGMVRSVPGGRLTVGAIPSAIHPVTLLSVEYRQLIAGLTLDIQSLSTQEILRRLKEQDMQNRRMLDEVFVKSGAKPNVVLETNAIRILLAESLSGRAFSVMPLSALPTPYAGTGVHTIVQEHAADVCLVRLKREAQPPLSDAVWRLAANIDLQSMLDRPLA